MRVRVIAWILLAAWLVANPATAADRASAVATAATVATVATVATLTVLSGKVERVARFTRAPAVSGSDLSTGDRVVTGADGRALITCLDGSTVVVEPASDVSVGDVDVGARDRSRVRLMIIAGTVWARLARWLGGRGSMSLESNAYAATAHDGLIGAQSRPDGAFVCWTRDGVVSVTDAGGKVIAAVEPGRKVTVAGGEQPVGEVFAVNQSALEISASGPVLPLVVMPGGMRVAGFVEPGIEVNQVFGSLTAVRDRNRIVDVPAGAAGRYVVVLAATGDGPYSVDVVGRYQRSTVYTDTWAAR